MSMRKDAAVPVDIQKLSGGMKAVFTGCAMLFEALGAPGEAVGLLGNSTDAVSAAEAADTAAAMDKPGEGRGAKAKKPDAQTAEDAGGGTGEPSGGGHKGDAEAVGDTGGTQAEPVDSGPADTEGDSTPNPEPEDTSAPAVAVTADDITKVIVAKIKLNRKNSDKIGALLKSYGCAKVSQLKDTQYEAFLGDLAQI